MRSKWKQSANMNEESREKNRKYTKRMMKERSEEQEKKIAERQNNGQSVFGLSWPTNRDNILLKWFWSFNEPLVSTDVTFHCSWTNIIFAWQTLNDSASLQGKKFMYLETNVRSYWMCNSELFSAFFTRSHDGFSEFIRIYTSSARVYVDVNTYFIGWFLIIAALSC